jgi:hypothetical protein
MAEAAVSAVSSTRGPCHLYRPLLLHYRQYLAPVLRAVAVTGTRHGPDDAQPFDWTGLSRPPPPTEYCDVTKAVQLTRKKTRPVFRREGRVLFLSILASMTLLSCGQSRYSFIILAVSNYRGEILLMLA